MRRLGRPSSIAVAMPPSASTSAMCAERARGQVVRQPLDVGEPPQGSMTRGSGRSPSAGRAGCCGRCAPRRSRRQGQRFVERVGVQALGVRPASPPSPRAGARDVVVGVLRRQRPAGGLGMGAQRQRARVLGRELCWISFAHSSRAARCLATSMKKFMPAPRRTTGAARTCRSSGRRRRRRGHIRCRRPGCRRAPGRRRPGFLHVVAGDRDRVELRHLSRRVGEDVGDDPHRGLRRVDVGVADHELLEDVVLDGARRASLAARPVPRPATM